MSEAVSLHGKVGIAGLAVECGCIVRDVTRLRLPGNFSLV